jgi:hypothetical protein
MKRTILALAMLIAFQFITFAQSNYDYDHEQVHYHFFINNVPDNFNYPLIGIINNVKGDHASIQLGLINSTNGNFSGAHAALINSVNGTVKGVQSGFINSVNGSFYGIEHGFINSVNGKFSGIQIGFINSVDRKFAGIQAGFINSNEKTTGIQSGFINTSKKGVTGVQTGFINTAGSVNGVQAGFINSAKNLKGLQLGFINSVDNLEKGLPIGFLSFVKNGGYSALEVAYNNIYPLNISFKTGVRGLYTYPMLAYDGKLSDDKFAFGYGIGSNLDLGSSVFINPELEWLHQVSLDFNHYSTIRCNLGLNLSHRLELLAGPSLVWQVKIDAEDFHQNYTVWDPSIVAINKVKAGFNVALRYKF